MTDGQLLRLRRCRILSTILAIGMTACVLMGATCAFAWLTDFDMCVNDLSLAELTEPDYAAIYATPEGTEKLIFGRGSEVPDSYEQLPLVAFWRGLEDGSMQKTGSARSLFPWYEHRDRVTEIRCHESAQRAPIAPLSMSDMFFYMDKAQIIELSGISIKSATTLYEAFCSCSAVESLELSHWKSSSIASLGSMFSGCYNLRFIDMSGIATTNASTANMLSRCDSLEEIRLSRELKLKPSTGQVNFPKPPPLRDGSIYLNGGGYWYLQGAGTPFLPEEAQATQNENSTSSGINVWKADKVSWEEEDAYAALYANAEGSSYLIAFGRGSVAPDEMGSRRLVRTSREIELSDLSLGWSDFASKVDEVLILEEIRPSSMKNWFANMSKCSAFRGLDHIDASRTTSLERVFYGCSSLCDVNEIQRWNTSSCTNMANAFRNCSGIEKLDLSHWSTNSVKAMSGMFCGCSSMRTLDLSGWDTSKVSSSYSDFFSNMPALCQVTLSRDFLMKPKTGNSSYALLPTPSASATPDWDGCWYIDGYGTPFTPSEVAKYQFSGQGGSHADTTWMAFAYDAAYVALYGTPGNLTMVFGRGNPSEAYDEAVLLQSFRGLETGTRDFASSSAPWFSSRGDIIKATCDDTCFSDGAPTLSPLTTEGMFAECASMREADLRGLRSSRSTSMRSLFNNCTSLQTIDLGIFDTTNITDMSYAFAGTSSLERIDGLATLDVGNVTDFIATFRSCNVPILDLSAWEPLHAETMSEMFRECTSAIELPKTFVRARVKSISMMFYYSDIEELDISAWDVSGVTNMWKAFERCLDLRSLGNLSGWDTGHVQEMGDMFFMCPELELDCSMWNVSNVISHGNFNFGSEGIVSPWSDTENAEEGTTNTGHPLIEEPSSRSQESSGSLTSPGVNFEQLFDGFDGLDIVSEHDMLDTISDVEIGAPIS